MFDVRGLPLFVLTIAALFYVSYQIGMLLRGQMLAPGSFETKLLIFFAVVALVGGLLGAHAAPGAIARHNRGSAASLVK
jgi:hypothetical protein